MIHGHELIVSGVQATVTWWAAAARSINWLWSFPAEAVFVCWPVRWPTQPPMQCVPAVLYKGLGRETDFSLRLVHRCWIIGRCALCPRTLPIALCLDRHGYSLTYSTWYMRCNLFEQSVSDICTKLFEKLRLTESPPRGLPPYRWSVSSW
jgi:hypothetical protein